MRALTLMTLSFCFQCVNIQNGVIGLPAMLRPVVMDSVQGLGGWICPTLSVLSHWPGRCGCDSKSVKMTSSNGNIFRVTGPLCGEFTDHRWIPPTKASGAELLMFSLICAWTNGWVNNGDAGDLRRHRCNVIFKSHFVDWCPAHFPCS